MPKPLIYTLAITNEDLIMATTYWNFLDFYVVTEADQVDMMQS